MLLVSLDDSKKKLNCCFLLRLGDTPTTAARRGRRGHQPLLRSYENHGLFSDSFLLILIIFRITVPIPNPQKTILMQKDIMPHVKTPEKNDQIISYYALRILIGATGILLPLLLIIGNLIANRTLNIEFSVSDYYDNGTAGDILVGVLFVLGFFLMTYKGYDRTDSITANLGCLFALGVALFPTTSCNRVVHSMHFVFAVLLFSVFSFFSLYLFRKTDPAKKLTRQKEERNIVYLVCGIIMIACIAAIAVCMIWLDELSTKYRLVFWFESLALISFGISWITKAEFLFLKDEENRKKK